MNSTFADVTVTATSGIVVGSYVLQTAVAASSGPASVGATSAVSAVSFGSGSPVTFASGTTLVAASSGLIVLGSAPSPPSLSGYTIVVVAHPGSVTAADADLALVNGSYDPSKSASFSVPASGPATATLRVENLSKNTLYTFAVHAYDPSVNQVATVVAPGKTTADPVIDSVSVTRFVSAADLDVLVTDADSTATLRVALVPSASAAAAAQAEAELATRSYAGPFHEALAFSGSNVVASMSNLAPGTSYRVVAVAVDSVTGNVVSDTSSVFATYSAPAVSVSQSGRTFDSVTALSTHVFEMDGVDLYTAFVPNTPADVAAFVASNADPLGTMIVTNYPASGAYSLPFSASNLTSGAAYAAVSKAVPAIQPSELRSASATAVTAVPSAISFSSPAANFYDASVSVTVTDVDGPVDIYAAIHDVSVTPAAAQASLFALGSIAFPGAVVAVNRSTFSATVSRKNLSPGSDYCVTVVSVDLGGLISSKTIFFKTAAVPDLSVTLNSVTDESIKVDVASSGPAHDLFVHVTPFVVGNSPVYDANAIALVAASTNDTELVPGVTSTSLSHEFTGLIEHTRYGVVGVASQIGSHQVVVDRAIVVKTASAPDVSLSVTAVSPESVDFTVTGVDLDGPFRLLTCLSLTPFAAADARALALAGMASAAPNIVSGSITDFPNQISTPSVTFGMSVPGLDDDTQYFAVAVAVDQPTGVLRWAQQAVLTDFRPLLTVANHSSTSFSASFSLRVEDRDGPALAIKYALYPSAVGLSAATVAGDPGAVTVSSPGKGPRSLAIRMQGLSEARQYYFGAVAIGPKGETSALALLAFATDPRPVVNLEVQTVLARSLTTLLDVSKGAVSTYDATLAVLPHGAPVDDASVGALFDGTASNLIAQDSTLAGLGASVSHQRTFSSLTPGDRVTVVGAATRDDGEGDLVYASSNFWLRVEPSVVLSSGSLVARTTGASAVAVLAYNDPDASRSNLADVFASVMPAGDSNYAWLTSAALSNPVIPAAALQSHCNVDSVSSLYSTAGLSPATDYDLVVAAADHFLGESFLSVTPFKTRHEVAMSVSVASVSPGSASVNVSAALADGTFDLFADVFRDLAGSKIPDPGWKAVAPVSGSNVATGVSFAASQLSFGGLASMNDYVALAVAVDRVSGETFSAHAAFRTSAIPPELDIVNGSAVATSTSATLQLLARDLDSDFACYSKAYPRASADPVTPAILADVVANPDSTKPFRSSVARAPFQMTVTGLAPNSPYRLVAVVVDAVTGQTAHDFEDFDTLKTEDYLDAAEYDNGFELTWRKTATYSSKVRGVQSGNGKMAFRTRMDDKIGVGDVMMAGEFDFNSYGGYTNNIVRAFDPCTVSLVDHSLSPDAGRFTLEKQVLDMHAGLVRNSGVVTHHSGSFRLQHDVMALKQMPYCILNVYALTPVSAVAAPFKLFHEMSRGSGKDNVRFDSVTMYSPGSDTTVSIFKADGDISGSSHTLSCGTVYLFDSASMAGVQHVGYNTFRDLDVAFDSHRIPSAAAGATIRWATLTAQASSADFARPSQEIPRLLAQVVGSYGRASTNLYDVAVKLRADHVSAWNSAWLHSATLVPKLGLTPADAKNFYAVKRAIRYAQFQLFSSVRDFGTGELNPLQISSLDVDGNMFWNRELWIVPALIFLKPRAVRSLLENRFEALRAAKNIASAQGYEGARFPYVGDVVSYGVAAPYWDVASAGYVFNSALIAAASFDYFRATHDRAWLASKGYPIISAVADYIVDVSSVNPVTGNTSFPDVLDVNGQRVTDPSFTAYACRLALKAAIEASYELTYPIRPEWKETFAGINLSFFAQQPRIIKHHSAASLSDKTNILEPLLILQPYYAADFLKYDSDRIDTLLKNADHYGQAISTAYKDNPVNTLLRMAVYAQVNRTTGTHSAAILTLLLKAIADSRTDIWGAMSAQPDAQFNDVSLSALLVLAFVTSFAGMHVSGGVSPSSFYYENFGVKAHATSYLPKSWQNVVVTGGDGKTFNVINSDVY
jgi:hypothetical protein